jgi:hypothetical protein
VQQSTTVGIAVGGHGEKQKFPAQFVKEALLLSDILNMNELAAVELLLVSEQQKANFPGQTRGRPAEWSLHSGHCFQGRFPGLFCCCKQTQYRIYSIERRPRMSAALEISAAFEIKFF